MPDVVQKEIDSATVEPKTTARFTQALAAEIVKNLTAFGKLTIQPFQRKRIEKKKETPAFGNNPILLDTNVLIDGRILPIVNSGFFSGTLLVPKFVLGEIQHIADESDPIRRAKGRRGLDVVSKLKSQKTNPFVKTKILDEDDTSVPEVDHRLVSLAKKWKTKLLTIDFNLAQVARVQGVKVMNVNDLAQALKVALIPGEELIVHIAHAGKERNQGVGYLADGTMVVVEDAGNRIGQDVATMIIKIHQTPAGQLFFAHLK